MWSSLEAIAIYFVALFAIIQILHWLLTRLNLLSQLKPNTKEDLTHKSCETVADGLTYYPLTDTTSHSIHNCDIETTVGTEAVTHIKEGMATGIESLIEITGEHLASAIENCSN